MRRLDSLRVLLTRTAADSATWTGPLEAAGAHVTVLPCIRSELAADAATAGALRAALPNADWLALTSRRGAEALAGLIDPAEISPATRIAVVGPATAAATRDRLGRVDLTAPGGTARALGQAIVEDSRFGAGQRCLAALAANAGPVLTETLEAAGATCIRIDVYRTIPQPPATHKRPLSSLGASEIVFSSPTTVTGFVNQVEIDCRYRAWSIGPSTSAALRAAGLAPAGEAREPTIAGIVAAMEEAIYA